MSITVNSVNKLYCLSCVGGGPVTRYHSADECEYPFIRHWTHFSTLISMRVLTKVHLNSLLTSASAATRESENIGSTAESVFRLRLGLNKPSLIPVRPCSCVTSIAVSSANAPSPSWRSMQAQLEVLRYKFAATMVYASHCRFYQ